MALHLENTYITDYGYRLIGRATAGSSLHEEGGIPVEPKKIEWGDARTTSLYLYDKDASYIVARKKSDFENQLTCTGSVTGASYNETVDTNTGNTLRSLTLSCQLNNSDSAGGHGDVYSFVIFAKLEDEPDSSYEVAVISVVNPNAFPQGQPAHETVPEYSVSPWSANISLVIDLRDTAVSGNVVTPDGYFTPAQSFNNLKNRVVFTRGDIESEGVNQDILGNKTFKTAVIVDSDAQLNIASGGVVRINTDDVVTKKITPYVNTDNSNEAVSDLGDATHKWRKLYACDADISNQITTNSLVANGDAIIGGDLSVGNDLQVGNNLTVTGTITGNVTGNITGTADRATHDGNGNVITSTYVTFGGEETITGKKTFKKDVLIDVPNGGLLDVISKDSNQKGIRLRASNDVKPVFDTCVNFTSYLDFSVKTYLTWANVNKGAFTTSFRMSGEANAASITSIVTTAPQTEKWSLGNVNNKLNEIYAVKFIGNVIGNSDSADKAAYLSAKVTNNNVTTWNNVAYASYTSNNNMAILPETNKVCDLGSSSKLYKNVYVGSGGSTYFSIGYDNTGNSSEPSIIPSDDDYGYLGTPDYSLYRAYVYGIHAKEYIIPYADYTDDDYDIGLGSADYRWSSVYSHNYYVGDDNTPLDVYIQSITVTNATNAVNVGILGKNDSSNYPLLFTNSVNSSTSAAVNKQLYTDTVNSLYYNPYTNTLTCQNVSLGSVNSGSIAKLALYNSGTTDYNGISCTGSFLPSSNIIYNLGSPTYRWKDVYPSGGGSTYLEIGCCTSVDNNNNIETSHPVVRPSHNGYGYIGTPKFHFTRAYIDNIYVGSSSTSLYSYIQGTTVTNATNATNAINATNAANAANADSLNCASRWPAADDAGKVIVFRDVDPKTLTIDSNASYTLRRFGSNGTFSSNGNTYYMYAGGASTSWTNNKAHDGMLLRCYSSSDHIEVFTTYLSSGGYGGSDWYNNPVSLYINGTSGTGTIKVRSSIYSGLSTYAHTIGSDTNECQVFPLDDNFDYTNPTVALSLSPYNNAGGYLYFANYYSRSNRQITMDVTDRIHYSTALNTLENNISQYIMYGNYCEYYGCSIMYDVPSNVIQIHKNLMYIAFYTEFNSSYTSVANGIRGFLFKKESDGKWYLTHAAISNGCLTSNPLLITNRMTKVTTGKRNSYWLYPKYFLDNGIYYIYDKYHLDRVDDVSRNFFNQFHKLSTPISAN